ncbi:hypothetical protein [Pedobacter africanus]|uniref:Uncharacterized protein n=1 Tax=Pedobacter africanus TaxID=151894 RepID=A0A1W2E6B1_9SPHI|nr:hypothetical protein [Pedobacter africanus]SMD05323.1 hypothetical protein SAMN04488524_4458 [Pedobacter africanus]
MKINNFFYPLLVLFLAISCKKETTIQPDEIKPFYTLPQGNHPYDHVIVDFYHTYGCYILYKFSETDFRWNIANNIPYEADQGDENYIAASIDALDQYLFKFYSADFLKKALPYKIILSAKISEIGDPQKTPVSSVSTSSHFAFGHAGSSLVSMTAQELKLMKGSLNKEFWTQAIIFNKIILPPAFVAATNYDNVMSFNKKNFGVFMSPDIFSQTLQGDFLEYINIIATTTKEELERTLFLPVNDPNGKYKLKYNAVIDYYKQAYGIDLQAIAKG